MSICYVSETSWVQAGHRLLRPKSKVSNPEERLSSRRSISRCIPSNCRGSSVMISGARVVCFQRQDYFVERRFKKYEMITRWLEGPFSTRYWNLWYIYVYIYINFYSLKPLATEGSSSKVVALVVDSVVIGANLLWMMSWWIGRGPCAKLNRPMA